MSSEHIQRAGRIAHAAAEKLVPALSKAHASAFYRLLRAEIFAAVMDEHATISDALHDLVERRAERIAQLRGVNPDYYRGRPDEEVFQSVVRNFAERLVNR